MSADSWTECPKCAREAQERASAAIDAAAAAYGKVPAPEYEQLCAAAKRANRDELEDTLREDYEIGVRDGRFSVGFSAVCTKCGWRFSFTHGEILEVAREAAAKGEAKP